MIRIDYNKFITKFQEFKDLSQADVLLAEQQIGIYISPVEDTAVLNNALREEGCYLATAIICKQNLNLQNSTNQTTSGTIAGASEGSDSVSFQGVPYKTMLEWDLTSNDIQPYGKMLLRIIKLSAPKLAINTNCMVPYYNNLKKWN